MLAPQEQQIVRFFRSKSMDELQRNANNSIWHDGESTKLVYIYPLPLSPWRAGKWTFRGWKSFAERHIVVKSATEQYNLITGGVPEGDVYTLGNFHCFKSPFSHMAQFLNARDFAVIDGTPVLAAQDGKIIRIVQENFEWGDGPEFRDKLNFLDIEHASGEISEYCHLAQNSVAAQGLRVGSVVKKGQVIAIVGKTGWTDRDHLHFVVFRYDNQNPANPLEEGRKFKSLKVRFA